MKKIFLLLLLLCSSVFAQTYNIVETSYVTTTISQTVVLNSTMKSGGTFNFTVQAHNGGGNVNTNDTANVKILFYNGGTLVSTAATNYSGNLPIPTGYHGVDPAVPWTTLSISSTNCGGSCANITHAVVQMVGIDGAWWAGDYGPYYKQPSFTFNGGSNILYNPEFGAAPDGTLVQGWTASPQWGVCQGAYGGSNPCTTNYSGVTANMSNGGYSATGGTTSAAPGGYTAAPAVSMQPIYNNSANLYTTNIVPTSYNSPGGEGAANAFDNNPYTKYLNFDKQNAGVTIKLNQGRIVSGFKLTTANDFSGRDPTSYKLYASNDGRTWDKLGEGTLTLTEARYTVSDMITVTNTNAYFYYFIYFPTTKSGEGCGQNCNSMQIGDITYYYDENNTTTSVDTTPAGGSILNPGTPGATAPGMSEWPADSDITSGQTTQKAAAKNRVANVALGNSIYIEEKIGSSSNSVTIEQTGFYNKIGGLGGNTYAIINGSSNTVNIKQGDTLGKNLIEFSITGNTNNVTIWQSRNPTTGLKDGSESGGHYMGLNINGSTNTLSLKQSNDGGSSSGHFAYVDVTGNGNSGTLKQSSNGEKTFFGVIAGSSNIFDVTQQGSGSYLDLSLTGNGHNVTANQKDAGSHKATINLTNAGGASTVNLVQQGATVQNINITQQCATLSGCSVSVTQGQ